MSNQHKTKEVFSYRINQVSHLMHQINLITGSVLDGSGYFIDSDQERKHLLETLHACYLELEYKKEAFVEIQKTIDNEN